MKNKIWIYQLLILVMLLTTTSSCKKDDALVKKDPIITWANPADISFGTLLNATQLNATSDVVGTFVYTPTIGTRLNIGANQELKVDFTPNDSVTYNMTSKTVKINVNAKKAPIITWANPADISFGTLLSTTQLNATADVAGTFVYTPASGTSLNVGTNQSLKVDFTPNDAATYNLASKTVKINVTQSTSGVGVSSAVFNPTKTYGTMTDQNGNTYKTITIGNQTWMAENLRVTKYRNGTAIPKVTTDNGWVGSFTGAYCSYANTTNNDEIATYGLLYNWYAVSDSRNLAPTGWHIPTQAEWTQLTDYLGGTSVAGGKLKETGTTHWNSPNIGATNESGFTALPGGFRYLGGPFDHYGSNGSWWSSSMDETAYAWSRYMSDFDDEVGTSSDFKAMGFSVRCVKN